jgi:hypothetical protein
MSTVTIDGALSLVEQNQTLEFYQQQHRSKLESYEKDTVQMHNVATFQQLPLGAKIPTLTLIVVPTGQNPSAIQPANTILTFDSVVLVSNTSTRVAGFHAA